MVEMTVLGISLQENGSIPVLLLHPHGTQKILSLRIGPMEAFAISMALHKDSRNNPPGETQPEEANAPPAPAEASQAGMEGQLLTHDLLLSVIATLGGELVSVELLALKNGIFLTEAVLARGNSLSRVPCRPSDGVALALRCNAAISASEDVVAHAEDIELVMAQLPEYVRTLAVAKLAALPRKDGLSPLGRIPMAIEEALHMGAAQPGGHQELISVARKMLEEEQAKAARDSGYRSLEKIIREPVKDRAASQAPAKDAPKTSPQSVTFVPASPEKKGSVIKVQPIRITVTPNKRKPGGGALDELPHPGTGMSKEDLARLGLTPPEAEAFQDASAKERWATLLRMLAPETKVPM